MSDKKKIIIVEDDNFMSDIYHTKLSAAGFDVKVAGNGKKALELLEKGDWLPELMLLDIIMPEMDGFQTLKALKSDDKLKKIAVILLTNLGQGEDVKQGLTLGAVDYLIKSHFTPQEVLEKINEHLL